MLTSNDVFFCNFVAEEVNENIIVCILKFWIAALFALFVSVFWNVKEHSIIVWV